MSIDATRKQAILRAFGGILAVAIGSVVVYLQRSGETLFIPAVIIIGWATLGGALVQLFMGARAEKGLGRVFVLLGGVALGFIGGVATFALIFMAGRNQLVEEGDARTDAIAEDLQVVDPITLDHVIVVSRGASFDSANFSTLMQDLMSHPEVERVSYSAEEGPNLLLNVALLDATKVDAAALSALVADLDCKVLEIR